MAYENWASVPQFWTGMPTFNNPTGGLPADLQNSAPSHINWDKPFVGDLYPTYGNYGGEGYSAGHYASEPGVQYDWSTPGVDLLDNLFKAHDLAYRDAEGQPDQAALINAADFALIVGILGLWVVPEAWNSLAASEQTYAADTLGLFMVKLAGGVLHPIALALDPSRWIPSPLNLIFHDPVVFDLDGNGITLSALQGSTVHFDFDGDGLSEQTGWVGASDGMLAIDDNNNGIIDNGLELFGSSTQDGFAVLEKLDSNGDGRIDAQDTQFAQLRVWKDLNQNGISDSGELQTLSEAGIASISLTRQSVNGSNAGHIVGYEAQFIRADGTQGAAQTIYFQTDRQNSTEDNTPAFTPDSATEFLPNLMGSGTIHSIIYKATVDADFRAAWTELSDNAASMSVAELRDKFEAILLQWAGVNDVDPQSRGQYVDARHLAFVEAFFGEGYREIQRDQELRTYPSSQNAGNAVEASFHGIAAILELSFLAQTAGSTIARGNAQSSLVGDSPYLYFFLLGVGPESEDTPTPEKLGLVLDLILSQPQPDYGAATEHLIKALNALSAMTYVAFDGDREAYANLVNSHLSSVTDATIRDIATHIVDGTALLGSIHAEGINGTSGNDVFIGGGGGDVVSGGAGSDIYVYAKHDGDLWIRDDGPGTDTDRLVLTDLNRADVSLVRIGDTLLIKATETGKAVTVENFFNGNGIDILRFADGTELDRTHIKDASITQGDGHNNAIYDSGGDDVIHGAQGDDWIRISGGDDTILYGKGDGYDVVTDWSNSPAEHDTFILTDINSNDVELSRVGGDLILTVKSTGEYVDFTNFFPVGTGDWNISARNIDTIKFADGEAWNRSEIQEKAWYRGTDHVDFIQASELNDTIVGGKGDDVLEGWTGSDTFIWSKGDGNDQISDFSSKFVSADNNDIDTLVLTDVSPGEVSFSYQGSTLLISVNSTGEVISVPSFFIFDAAFGNGIDVIKFKDGETIDRGQIYQLTGGEFLGWHPTTYTEVFQGKIIWQYFVDEFGHAGNIVGDMAPGPDPINDIWNASSAGGWGGIFGIPDDLQPTFFHGGGNNLLFGNAGNDFMAAGGADDVLYGQGGDDVLWGDFPDESVGGGNDILIGAGGNDVLYGGPGSDMLEGDAGNDYLVGGAGKDTLSGGVGDDVYIGGLGDDVLIGNDAATTGNDTYIYSLGDGNDIIFESGSADSAFETDRLVLTDIDLDHVELSRSGDDLLIRVLATGDIITVVSHFSYRLNGSNIDNSRPGAGLEYIDFADWELDRKQIQEAAWIRGTDGRDILTDSTTNAQQDQTFDGGKGNDVFNAGRGGNTFVYASGDGNDIIFDQTNNNFGPDSIDKLKFTNLNPGQVQLERSGDDLLVKILATGEVITIVSQFTQSQSVPGSGLEFIQYANGVETGREGIQQQAWYRGTDGADFIQLSGWNDTVEGGKGDDIIYAGYQSGSGNDTFVYARGDGNDFIREETWHSFSSSEIDVLQFKDIESSDIVLSRSDNDLLIKIISTNETITVSHQFSDDAGAPGQGLEFIQFANGDQLGRETILSIVTSSAPFIVGGNGNDTLVGSSATQNIYGEAGNDIIDGQGGSDLLYGGQGNDTLKISVSAAGDLATVNGGVGTDTLDLGGFGAAAWVDLVTSGAEVRTTDQSDLTTGTWRDVAEVEQVENITGTAFADQISGDAGNNVLIGGAGADVLDGRSGDDTILGDADNDTLTGGMGADRLDGGDGADTLNGGLGQDTLIGGAGDDVLTGGADSDIFAIGAGAGADIVTDFVAGSGSGHDLIRFDRSVFTDYASVLAASTQTGSDVVVDAGGGNTVTLQNVDLAALTVDNFEFRRLENQAPTAISVTGGTVAENATVGTVVATLTAVDSGDAGTHTFSIVGSDSLFEIVGNEIRVKAGAVVDFEAASQHTLNVKAMDDDGLFVTSAISIAITDQTETLTGTSGNNVLTAGAGTDILIGGLGNDRLTGGAGSDEYRYNLGDGSDRIIEQGNAADVDRLVLGAGIDPSSVSVGRSSRDNTDIVLRFADGGTVVLQDQLSSTQGSGVEQIVFDDTTTWSRADILSRLDDHLIIGSSENAVLAGSAAADVFIPGTGDETLSGGGGDDVYRVGPGSGHDTIVENYDDVATDRIELVGLNSGDVEFFREGYDLVIQTTTTGDTTRVVGQFGYSGSGVEEIVFADATVWDKATIAANAATRGTSSGETVVGTPGDDVLQPGPGDDIIQAGAGSDTIIYALGDGNDTINDGANSAAQVDVLRFVDLNAGDVQFSRQGSDLVIDVTSSGESIKVVGQFTSPTDFWGIEEVHFADGTVWDQSQISTAAWIRGTSGAETLYGTSDADVIDGRGGDDSLRGGNGGDTYLYKSGSGNDIIYENSGDGGTDTVKLVGLVSSDVELSRSGNDLLIRIVSSGETLKVDNQFNGSNGIEQLVFADNVTWDRGQIADASPVRGTAGDDMFFGSADAEVFDGKGGNDYLHGGGGGDTYIYGPGSGNDLVSENSGDTGTDIIKLAGLNASDVTFSRSGNDLFVQINATSETLKVENQFNGTNGIDQVTFTNGAAWDRSQIADAAWVRGSVGNDMLFGSSDAEVFDGKGGDDYLHGGGGGDTYIYGPGSGNDLVSENSGDTGDDLVKLVGLNRSDILLSRSGNDLFVQINATSETLKVENQFNGLNGIEVLLFADAAWDRSQIADAAWVRGTAGNDTLFGSSDAEVFDGKGGNDYLHGSGGGDTYIYAVGSGNDVVAETSGDTGDDVVKLAGLNNSDVLFSRSGSDLFIQISSSGETLKIENQFNGTNGIEQVKFADGSTWDRAAIFNAAWVLGTSGNDTLFGSSDAEVFDGKGGNDYLHGGGGGDTYLFGAGSGNDTISENSGDTGNDVIKLVDLNSSDVVFSHSGSDLLIQIVATGETLKVENQFNGSNGIEEVVFADGTTWDRTQIDAASWYRGTSSNDSIIASSSDDTLFGGLGNDYLRGNDGADTYIYASGHGNDEIDDQSPSTTQIDTLKLTDLNPGDVTLSRTGDHLFVGIDSTGETIKVDYQFYSTSANWGIEKIEFANGDSWDIATINSSAWYRGTSGSDSITASSSDDILFGNLGNDYLRGNDGADTYIYASGHGNDEIDDQSPSTTQIDTLKLTDLNPGDVTLSRAGDHLFVGIDSTGETIKVDYQFYSTSANWGIEKIEFANGDSWDLATINSSAWYRGTSGSDSITASSSDDVLFGNLGNDYLRGSDGADTYIYASGHGNDEIDDQSPSTTQIDTLKLTDLNPGDVTLSRTGDHLLVGIDSTGETIKVDNQFYSQTGNWGIEKIEFANNTSWDLATINANAWIRGTSSNDAISGTSWNDTIAGGAGNDTLSGGSGDDTFVFRAGLGQDTVTDFTAGHDVLEFHDGIFADAAAALSAASASGSDTLITIDATTSVLLQNVALANLHAGDFHIV